MTLSEFITFVDSAKGVSIETLEKDIDGKRTPKKRPLPLCPFTMLHRALRTLDSRRCS